jgi:asparagine synthase (glutamine-hydrolysing)
MRHELEGRGWRFRTHSDRELLLTVYRQAGDGTPSLLNGRFAFIIWDSEKNRLTAAVDRMSRKPLYYAYIGKQFLIASEIKALLETGLPREIDERSLLDFLVLGVILDDRTLFKGIRKLLPGQILTIRREGLEVSHYWKPDFVEPAAAAGPETEDLLSHLLREALRVQLHNRGPIACRFQSHGASASVAFLISELLGGGLRTFSASWYWDYAPEEKSYIESASSLMGSQNTHVLLKTEQLIENLDRILWHLEDPVLAREAYALYFLTDRASLDVDVLLDTSGAAEIFEGGGLAREEISASLGAPFSANRIPQALWKENKILAGLLSHDVIRAVGDYEPTAALRDFLQARAGAPGNFDVAAELTLGLPSLLISWDKIAASLKLDVRHPLMDNSVISFALSLPCESEAPSMSRRELYGSVLKKLTRTSLFDRTRAENVQTPLAVSRGSATRDLVRKVLLDLKSRQRGLFDPAKLRVFLQKREIDSRQMYLLWKILCIEVLCKRYFDKLFLQRP